MKNRMKISHFFLVILVCSCSFKSKNSISTSETQQPLNYSVDTIMTVLKPINVESLNTDAQSALVIAETRTDLILEAAP
jgi:hypothetical protein